MSDQPHDTANEPEITSTPEVQKPTPPTPPHPLPKPSIERPVLVPELKPRTPLSKKKLATIVGSILAVLVLIGVGTAAGIIIADKVIPNASPSLSTTGDGNATVTETESSIAAVAEKVAPSVVSIVTETSSASYFGGTTTGEAAGTGIIVSKDGYVMTNNHVLQDATNVSIVDSTGELYEDVTIVGRDPLNDVAFLKINSDKTFTAATLGNSATVRTGQSVVAIGNALGQYSNTVTSGIISGTGRTITASTDSTSNQSETLTDLVQTDASINPGNSGGPLVNLAGQVIGINTAIVEDSNGIGFAIPINATKGVLAEVLENGKVSRAYLGVNYLSITPDVAREYNLTVKSGAYVHASGSSNPIASGSPADKAGLQSSDIITKINNEAIGTGGSLSSILGEYRPGDKITITYLRDGAERTSSTTLTAYSK